MQKAERFSRICELRMPRMLPPHQSPDGDSFSILFEEAKPLKRCSFCSPAKINAANPKSLSLDGESM